MTRKWWYRPNSNDPNIESDRRTRPTRFGAVQTSAIATNGRISTTVMTKTEPDGASPTCCSRWASPCTTLISRWIATTMAVTYLADRFTLLLLPRSDSSTSLLPEEYRQQSASKRKHESVTRNPEVLDTQVTGCRTKSSC